MISPDSPLPKNFRFYDAQIKWLAPGGLTFNVLADQLYEQWLKHAAVKQRYGMIVSRDAAVITLQRYIQAVFRETVSAVAALPQPLFVARPVPERPKARKCCGQK